MQAPEVFIGNYGVEADLWAAAMMMYQLLAGRFPYWPTMDSLNTTSLEQVRVPGPCGPPPSLPVHSPAFVWAFKRYA